jgi:hypothetical protein
MGDCPPGQPTPYGDTVSLWSSGAILTGRHHLTGVRVCSCSPAGALAGFTLIGLVAHGRLWAATPLAPGPEGVIAGVLHWFALGVAVSAVALLALIPTWVAWPLGSFAAPRTGSSRCSKCHSPVRYVRRVLSRSAAG